MMQTRIASKVLVHNGLAGVLDADSAIFQSACRLMSTLDGLSSGPFAPHHRLLRLFALGVRVNGFDHLSRHDASRKLTESGEAQERELLIGELLSLRLVVVRHGRPPLSASIVPRSALARRPRFAPHVDR